MSTIELFGGACSCLCAFVRACVRARVCVSSHGCEVICLCVFGCSLVSSKYEDGGCDLEVHKGTTSMRVGRGWFDFLALYNSGEWVGHNDFFFLGQESRVAVPSSPKPATCDGTSTQRTGVSSVQWYRHSAPV